MLSKLLLLLLLLIPSFANAALGSGVTLTGKEYLYSSTTAGSLLPIDNNTSLQTGWTACVDYKWNGTRYAGGSDSEFVWLFHKSSDFNARISRVTATSNNVVRCAADSNTVETTLQLDQEWHHYCCQNLFGTLFVWVDGAPRSSVAISNYTPANTPLYLGSYDGAPTGVVSGGSWANFVFSPTVSGGNIIPTSYPNFLYNGGKRNPIFPVANEGSFAWTILGHPLNSYYIDNRVWGINFKQWTQTQTGRPITPNSLLNASFAISPATPNVHLPPVRVTGPADDGYTMVCLNNGLQVGTTPSCVSPIPNINSQFIPIESFGSGLIQSFESTGCAYTKYYDYITGIFGSKLPTLILGLLNCNMSAGTTTRAIIPFVFPASSDGRFWFDVEWANNSADIGANTTFQAQLVALNDGSSLDSSPTIPGSYIATLGAQAGTQNKFSKTGKSSIAVATMGNTSIPCINDTCKNSEIKLYLYISDVRGSGDPISRYIKGITVYWLNIF